jgi:integrase
MRVYKTTYRDRAGRTRETSKWYVEFSDHQETTRRLPGFTDKAATMELGRKLVKLAAVRGAHDTPGAELMRWFESMPPSMRETLVKWGMLESRRVAASKTLAAHLDDFETGMKSRGRSPQHVSQTVGYIRSVFKRCRFTYWSDVTPGRVERALADLRADKPGENEGETVRGLGMRASNARLVALKGFARWMVRDGRASESPFESLRPMNQSTDVRRKRRALTPDELRKLIHHTSDAGERCGIPGPERAMLYRLAVESGLRASELRSLTRASFQLDSAEPSVTVAAGYSKRRREDALPLRPETANALRGFLAGKLPNARAFRIPNADALAATLRADLVAAGVKVEDDAARTVDFHALRHTFITNLRLADVHPKTAQSLARHSTITLTLGTYTHSFPGDESAALALLPNLDLPTADTARMTGTDAVPVLSDCWALESGKQGSGVSADGRRPHSNGSGKIPGKTLVSQQNQESGRGRIRTFVGITPPDLQSGPVGHFGTRPKPRPASPNGGRNVAAPGAWGNPAPGSTNAVKPPIHASRRTAER